MVASVTLLVGIAGSGKSHYARANFTPEQTLSTDEFRARLADTPAAIDADSVAVEVLLLVLNERCRRGLDSVVDSTGLRPSFRRSVRDTGARHGAHVHVVTVSTPLAECLVRNSFRASDRRVREEVLVEQHAAFERAVRDVASEGYHSVLDVTGAQERKRLFVSIPVSENFGSSGAFRPERRAFYQSAFDVLVELGMELESAALNEDWGAVKLATVQFTKYDIAAIERSDGLLVITNTRLGSDIYLEIGLAAAQHKPVLLVVPWATRLTFMLEGMLELGALSVLRFDAERDVPELLRDAGAGWLDKPGRTSS